MPRSFMPTACRKRPSTCGWRAYCSSVAGTTFSSSAMRSAGEGCVENVMEAPDSSGFTVASIVSTATRP